MQRVIEIIARQADRHSIATKIFGLADLLLGRCHRHEDHTLDPEMATHEGHPLRVIARAGTDKLCCFGVTRQYLAHRIERAAQFVGTNRREIFPLEQDFGVVTL